MGEGQGGAGALGARGLPDRVPPRARRDLKKLPADVRHRLAPHIDALAQNPRPPGVVKLSAEEDTYRIRVGSFRVVYEIRDEVLLVTIVKVKSRGDVYR